MVSCAACEDEAVYTSICSLSSLTAARRFKRAPLKTLRRFETRPAALRYERGTGRSVTEAMMLQRRGCCWTREIFVENTSVWLCGDIPVCQPRPASETPARRNVKRLRNGRASLTDERPAGRSPGSQVSWRNISSVSLRFMLQLL
ncbi:hypothetical protein ROHU_027916 [Labeo rohita]|uniref:Uncharacterized protein n=1 Tax=Labeo rohita TaxID=84645 RepID=A0A498M941_LABRO|nr:hypothetical protein ROHU_027916 [Labeo rohita]